MSEGEELPADEYHDPEVLNSGEIVDTEEFKIAPKHDQSVIKDMVDVSRRAKALDKQISQQRLIGPMAKTKILKNDLPEIQILKSLAHDYNAMEIQDIIREQKLADESPEEIFFLDEDRIKEKRSQLESMARVLNSSRQNSQKIHNSDTRLLKTFVEYRKELREMQEEERALIQDEADHIDGAIGGHNAEDLTMEELMAEAEGLGMDANSVMSATFEEKQELKDEAIKEVEAVEPDAGE